MRKALFLMLALIFISIISSCRPRKERCPAYGQTNTEVPVSRNFSANTI